MTQLIVRDLDDDVVRELEVRAARNGRSAEAEHREILRQTLCGSAADQSLMDMLLDMPDIGSDADFERPCDFGRPVERTGVDCLNPFR